MMMPMTVRMCRRREGELERNSDETMAAASADLTKHLPMDHQDAIQHKPHICSIGTPSINTQFCLSE
jgi:hypothetical protein